MTNDIVFDGDDLSLQQIPNPTGWRITLGPIRVNTESAGGIIMSSDTIKEGATRRFIAKVLKMGPLCYKADKFRPHPNAEPQPWCKVGDVISIGQYTGSTLPCIDNEGRPYNLKVINDDEVNCVISDTSILDIH